MKLPLCAGLLFPVLLLCGPAFAQGGPPLLTDDSETPGNRNWGDQPWRHGRNFARGIPGSTGNEPGFIAYAGLQILLGPAKR